MFVNLSCHYLFQFPPLHPALHLGPLPGEVGGGLTAAVARKVAAEGVPETGLPGKFDLKNSKMSLSFLLTCPAPSFRLR